MENKIRTKKTSKLDFFWDYLTRIILNKNKKFASLMFSYDPHDHEQHQNLYYTDNLQNKHCITLTKKQIDNIGLAIKKNSERIDECLYKGNPDKILLYAITYANKKEGALLIAKIDGFYIAFQVGNYPIHITQNISCLFRIMDKWLEELARKEPEEASKIKLDISLTKEIILKDAA